MTERAMTELWDAVEGVAEEIAAVLRSGVAARARIPGAEWTAGEAAAHLVLANELLAQVAGGARRPYGDGTPGGLAAANAASLATFPERDPVVLADRIERGAREFRTAAAGRPADAQTQTPMGRMDLATLASYQLTHLLGHGYDIAAAAGRPLVIDRERVTLTLPFLRTAMPRVVHAPAAAGHTACYDLLVPGCGRFAATFDDGRLTVTDTPPRRPDCVIRSAPATFFLIALGRRTALGALARGHIATWGRKPWLAPRFPSLFRAP
jgi:uncharacterized protein (TIGR03083 family)